MARASGEMQSETKYGAEHQTGFKMADSCLVPCSCPAVGQLSHQIRNNSDWLTNILFFIKVSNCCNSFKLLPLLWFLPCQVFIIVG